MAERHATKAAGTREAERSPLGPEQFRNTPEFRRFRAGMKKLLLVSKGELDMMVAKAKKASPRANNPNAPGRKPHTG